jgi:hypothetical protein
MAGCKVGIMHKHLHIGQELGKQPKRELQIPKPMPLKLQKAIHNHAAIGISKVRHKHPPKEQVHDINKLRTEAVGKLGGNQHKQSEQAPQHGEGRPLILEHVTAGGEERRHEPLDRDHVPGGQELPEPFGDERG